MTAHDPDLAAPDPLLAVLQGSHFHQGGTSQSSARPNRCDDDRSRRTQETAEPVGVSPPEAVDLSLIKRQGPSGGESGNEKLNRQHLSPLTSTDADSEVPPRR